VPNEPDLEFATRAHNEYLFNRYIEPRFAKVPIREMKVLVIDEWLLSLCGAEGRPLSGTTKSAIRSLLSKCFKLAAKHEFISPFQQNPMRLVEVLRMRTRIVVLPGCTRAGSPPALVRTAVYVKHLPCDAAGLR
jgi:hypothetical protein